MIGMTLKSTSKYWQGTVMHTFFAYATINGQRITYQSNIDDPDDEATIRDFIAKAQKTFQAIQDGAIPQELLCQRTEH
jgi:hypothetical protein